MGSILAAPFADPEVEARYQRSARTLRLPFVRLYIGLLAMVVVAYAIIDPLFISTARASALSVAYTAALIVLGGYAATTFAKDYADRPITDMIALLCLAASITAINAQLFDVLIAMQLDMHAIGVINRLGITAFAAVALAGRPRLFAAYLPCDLALFLSFVMQEQAFGPGVLFLLLSYAGGAAIAVMINLTVGASSRRSFALSEALDAERARAEAMVHNMLPPSAAQRLRDGQMVADSYGDTTVIFIDIVGFSSTAKRVSPGHLVQLLNGFFNLADRCAAESGVEKVKTIGDAYLAISGGNHSAENSADAAIAFARSVIAGVDGIATETGIDLKVRIGIHSGPVVGGVIGATRMAYDYWGETMNIAARIEGAAEPNGIAISESCWMRTRMRGHFGAAETLTLKGVGDTTIYRSLTSASVIADLPRAAA
jgi:adenylate cyclase